MYGNPDLGTSANRDLDMDLNLSIGNGPLPDLQSYDHSNENYFIDDTSFLNDTLNDTLHPLPTGQSG